MDTQESYTPSAAWPAERFDNDTGFDVTQAFKEGWTVSDMCQGGPGRFQLQKLDDPGLVEDLDYDDPKFASDDDAWAHVGKLADSGSEYHRSAIAFLRNHSPLEFERFVSAGLSTYAADLAADGFASFSPSR